MKNYFWGTVLIVLILGSIFVGYDVYSRVNPKSDVTIETFSEPALMPWPKDIRLAKERFYLDKDFSVGYSKYIGEKSVYALNRFYQRLGDMTAIPFSRQFITAANLTSQGDLLIMCDHEGITRLGEDESYTLNITNQLILLRANTELGVIHGMETLLQLVRSDERGYYIPAGEIVDAPRFAWRGLMIDPCRHFISKETILRNLDLMATVKLNVLHLHLSEDQGFRVESQSFPKLQELASDGNYFTQEDIRKIVHHADLLGIRVVPEFDMPGHSTSWLTAYPELATVDSTYQLIRTWGVYDPVMDPSKEGTYQFLDTFIGEMAALFPDPYFHIGGDENNGHHWSQAPHITAFKEKMSFKSNHELQSYFIDRVKKIVKTHGKTTLGWGEILDLNMDTAIITQFWGPRMKDMEAAFTKGYRGIISNGYYIDLFQSTAYHYMNDPFREDLVRDPALEKQLLGAEATIWAEFVTEDLFDLRVWPRMAAIAERFWSPKTVTDVEFMYQRLPIISRYLELNGSTHIQHFESGLRQMAGTDKTADLRFLLDLLEPVEGYKRHQLYIHKNDTKYTQQTPLTRAVDYAHSDAPNARDFRRKVENLLSVEKPDKKQIHAVRKQLESFESNHVKLNTLLDQRPQLSELKIHSQNLTRLSLIGLEALNHLQSDQMGDRQWAEAALKTAESAKSPEGELELRIIDSIEALIYRAAAIPEPK